ncbi:DUF423 domain-containing protein [Jejuia pallidilutea]|uniref:DUF423 domain-containing protein n=1 Tax=Jejuia pallidilutea TaxID=504487 RepID=A0A090W932_9FLAO|nr:DUF423 domain-containing protein [Jejuia pallidilutea]GAL67737.1 hypothetical protein JCM19301_1024 [Jejuia pallidilutea]GAL72718.1 hypothetical protein JCM19302_3212 [Jejuia pallidilutea]GAL88313.1 hypothetical protein JCM19538_1639 [Jejuia pallidilutea]
MTKIILISAAILGVLSIILGAFASHGLKAHLSPENLQTFETGVRYQMYHALLLLFVGSTSLVSSGYKNIIFYLVIFGVVLFSGSIYGLATNQLSSFNFKSIGFITPIGGLFLIASWVVLIINFVKLKS